MRCVARRKWAGNPLLWHIPRLSATRIERKTCHSEARNHRAEESALLLPPEEMQIPRFARDDRQKNPGRATPCVPCALCGGVPAETASRRGWSVWRARNKCRVRSASGGRPGATCDLPFRVCRVPEDAQRTIGGRRGISRVGFSLCPSARSASLRQVLEKDDAEARRTQRHAEKGWFV